MRKVILLCVLLIMGYGVSAQFPTTDSLRNYNTRYTTNSAINWFTNLRGQTLLRGMIDWIDSARLGISGSVGVDTVFTINDSTLRYRKNGSYHNVVIRGAGGSSSGIDSLYVRAAEATGTRIFHISGDTLKLSNLVAGTNITLTKNADSSITIAASGGGGSPGGSNTQVQFNNSSAFGGDAGLTYNSTTNTLTTDSIVMNNISLQRMLRNLGGGSASDSIGFGACVIRGDASGGSGSLISWSFINDASHTKTFFTNVYGNVSGSTIHLSYPAVGKIMSMVAVPDETLAGRGIFLGSSVMDTSADIYVYQHILSSGLLTGNGTNFTVSGDLTRWTTTFNSGTGAVSFLPPANLYYNTAGDANNMSANYIGSNNYRLRRKTSGLGSDIVGWVMVDNVTNTDVIGVPTSSDMIEVTGLPFYRQVSAYQVSGSLYEASIWSANSNIWIFFTYKK